MRGVGRIVRLLKSRGVETVVDFGMLHSYLSLIHCLTTSCFVVPALEPAYHASFRTKSAFLRQTTPLLSHHHRIKSSPPFHPFSSKIRIPLNSQVPNAPERLFESTPFHHLSSIGFLSKMRRYGCRYQTMRCDEHCGIRALRDGREEQREK